MLPKEAKPGKSFVDKETKRPVDVWNEVSVDLTETDENRWESYLRDIGQHSEGVSAEKEKFNRGIYTASYKVFNPNKH